MKPREIGFLDADCEHGVNFKLSDEGLEIRVFSVESWAEMGILIPLSNIITGIASFLDCLSCEV